jgi:hypothetical protein
MQGHSKAEALSYNEGNEVAVLIRGTEIFLGEVRCLNRMLNNERKMLYSIALFGNFETEIDEWNTQKRRYLLCDEGDNGTYRSLKFTNTQRRREKLLNNMWPNMSVEVAFRKLLTGDKVIDLRKLVTLA